MSITIMITSYEYQMEQHRMFLGTPCQLSPTIIKSDNKLAMFETRQISRGQDVLHSKVFIGRVLQRFRKNGVIEGDGRGVVPDAAAAPAPTGRRQQTVQTAARAGRRSRRRPGRKPCDVRAVQEAPADARARAG
ncbi:UNVERIFIED_CONTAM: hypothetical protein Sindi_2995300 [Sesamum indicum]